MLHREMYIYFPLVDLFAKRELPKKVAINVGTKVMQLRLLFAAIEERRLLLVEKHQKMVDGVIQVDGARTIMNDQAAFEKEWRELLEQESDNYPVFESKLNADDLPDDVTALEVEALLTLNLFE